MENTGINTLYIYISKYFIEVFDRLQNFLDFFSFNFLIIKKKCVHVTHLFSNILNPCFSGHLHLFVLASIVCELGHVPQYPLNRISDPSWHFVHSQ